MYPNHYEFPAFFYFDEDGISIEFPDLPGCLPCAQTTEEAFRNAKEALGLPPERTALREIFYPKTNRDCSQNSAFLPPENVVY